MNYLFALQTIRESAPEFINLIFVIISEYFIVLSFIVPAVIYWNIDKSAGATIIVGYGLSYELNQTIKNFACVYRPWILDSRLHIDPHGAKSATGYSFPSGHTTTAASVYGGISIWQKKRTWVVVLMSFLVLMTAFARNWLGAHTLKDVLWAVLLVGIWLCIINFLKYWLLKNPARDTVLCFGGIAISVILLIVVSVKSYPVDYAADGSILVNPYDMLTDCYSGFGNFTGILLGWWLQRHFLNFSTQVSAKAKILRTVTGALVCLLIYLTFGKIFAFTGAHISHLIKYFTIFFYILYLHPLFFTKVMEKGN